MITSNPTFIVIIKQLIRNYLIKMWWCKIVLHVMLVGTVMYYLCSIQ